MDKNINQKLYKNLFNLDKEISQVLSFFILIASFTGLFLLSKGKGITGFSVFELSEINNIGLGVILFGILIFAIVFSLINVVYLKRKSIKT